MKYDLSQIQGWSEKIEIIAHRAGLDYYPQEFELVNYEDMLSYEAYIGMPSRYPHWSFGKSYEKLKTLYQYNLTGLPYEMVINSDPCIAYLMKDNTLLLQILTIAHVYGHNDFFKNNRLFTEETEAEYTLEMFKSHARTIKSFINDPSIGYEKVERILDAAHALKLQTPRVAGEKKRSQEDLKKSLMEDYYQKASQRSILEPYREEMPPDINKIPLQPEEDLLLFIIKYGKLEDWENSILEIVRSETRYFIPQIETKVMNEGWASFWHYEILKELDLPSALYLEFIKRHNEVVRPITGQLNPYYLGFEMIKDLMRVHGKEKIFEVRACERDESFLRRYLTQELCQKLNLFEYVKKENEYFVENVPDDDGWKSIRNTLCKFVGMSGVPLIQATDFSAKDGTLTLEHVFDGRELEKTYAEQTLKYIADIWKRKVVLKTKINNTEQQILAITGDI
ncbi:MAG: hypothetical protein AWM53_01865 [Candidatus Dichloromethanomonas elyunquensis]|nr:MAG: hypothetical protein AWM53_01865 [Candidatus Dichloromethanomonas elyunquensis]